MNSQAETTVCPMGGGGKETTERSRAVEGGRQKALSLMEQFPMTEVRLHFSIEEAKLAELYFVSQSSSSRILEQMLY